MEILQFLFSVLILVWVFWVFKKAIKRVKIFEYENGLLYKSGKYVRLLKPGGYWINGWTSDVTRVDRRIKTETIAGQEILSEDHVGLKISLAMKYEIEDPEKAFHLTDSYTQDLYQTAQIALRTFVGTQKIEDLLKNRSVIADELLKKVDADAKKIGLKIHLIDVKDIMFPGDLKKIFAEEIKAKKEGQAALERARGESAALRNLANAAKMIEQNPALLDLRVIQAMSSGGENNNIFLTRFGKGGTNKSNDNS
jgi:regulator of protease activity HflC (stomatin/prohibitin superfamily)